MEKFEHLAPSFCPRGPCEALKALWTQGWRVVGQGLKGQAVSYSVCVETLILSLLLIPNQVPVASTVGPVWGPRGAIALLGPVSPWLEGGRGNQGGEEAAPEVVKPQTSCPRAPRDGHTESGALEKLYLLGHCFYTVRQKLSRHKFAH